MASGPGVALIVDVDGHPIEDPSLAAESPVPGLLVGPVTEAVKVSDDGVVVHHVDRDTLWAVEGFVLDEAVLDGLGEFVGSASDLLQAVTAAGFTWSVVG
jgi:hypothetical protein